MKTFEIKGQLRGSIGSKDAKILRREGQVPCVIYGGSENIHFHADIRELNKLVYTPNVYLVKLILGDKTVKAVVRDAQYHPVSDKLIHMDLTEVVSGSPITVMLPVVVTGSAIGVRNGGVLRQNAKKLKVKGMVDDMPEEIVVDVTDLKIGNLIKVGDLKLANVEILEAANRVVAAVRTSRKAVSEEEEAAEAAAAEGEEGNEAEAATEEAAAE